MKSAVRKIQSTDSVALTFDDGPHADATAQVLDVLKERRLCATFFVLGENCEKHPDVIRRICDEGHQIGIHGFSHFRHIGRRSKICLSIDRVLEILDSITNLKASLFRPPYGWWLPQNNHILEERGLTLVLWSIMVNDYHRNAAPDKTITHLYPHLRPSDIVVLHDNRKTARTAALYTALLADQLEEKHLKTSFIETA